MTGGRRVNLGVNSDFHVESARGSINGVSSVNKFGILLDKYTTNRQ